jgi:uncharacterized membrane protein
VAPRSPPSAASNELDPNEPLTPRQIDGDHSLSSANNNNSNKVDASERSLEMMLNSILDDQPGESPPSSTVASASPPTTSSTTITTTATTGTATTITTTTPAPKQSTSTTTTTTTIPSSGVEPGGDEDAGPHGAATHERRKLPGAHEQVHKRSARLCNRQPFRGALRTDATIPSANRYPPSRCASSATAARMASRSAKWSSAK